jgi:phosphoglucosamine mutase
MIRDFFNGIIRYIWSFFISGLLTLLPITITFGKEPLTPDSLVKLGKAVGKWITSSKKKSRIILAHDTRLSSSLCKAALKTGLLQFPLSLDDAEIIPTPLLFHLVQKQSYDLGIMITASHNQAEDNGIKIFTPSGKLNKADEQIISHYFYKKEIIQHFETLGQEKNLIDLKTWYLSELNPFFKNNFLKNTKVVIDCAHGATFQIAPFIFKQFGATLIPINTEPTGMNINQSCGSVYPEVLQKAVLEHQADCGFAFDGDGDRVIAINKDGHIKDGDDLLAILSQHKSYKDQNGYVGTIMSNQGLEQFFQKKKKDFFRTPVGDKYVTQTLKDKNLLLGAEPSGHIILRDFSTTSDGIFTALRILETAIQLNNFSFKSFQKFPQKKLNLPVGLKKDLTQEPFCSLINKQQQALKQGRLLVRYSGTEPVLRIMVEAPEPTQAETICASLSEQLKQALQN